MSEATWTTKDGRVIPVDEMTDEHILNTIKLIERNWAMKLITYGLADEEKMGDGASMAFQQEHEHLLEVGPAFGVPIYEVMLAVAYHRQITTVDQRRAYRERCEAAAFNYVLTKGLGPR